MWKPSKIILADASILILLDNAQLWYILESLFTEIYTTIEVQEEFGDILPSWIQVINYQQVEVFDKVSKIVGKGEASLLTYALEQGVQNEVLLLLDDLKARKLAERLNLNFTGLLGVLIFAKQQGIISELKSILEKLVHVGMRVSGQLLEKVLHEVGE